jgi:hypothetical protein
MLRRFLFLTSAAAFLVFGLGAFEARAGFVAIPTSLDALLPSGAYTTVAGAETLTFSNFSYSTIPNGVAPPSGIGVSPFVFGNETGLQFQSTTWVAAPGATLDITLSFVVTAPKGELLNDAVIIIAGGNFQGTGTISAGESLVNAVTLAPIGTMEAAIPGMPSASLAFPGVNSILVTKGILITGGTNGASLSVLKEGFSSTIVPEPTSMALLGIGMAGFFTYRRLFKRPSAV